MEITIHLNDEHVERLKLLVEALNARTPRSANAPVWTLESAVTVSAINGIDVMENRYLERTDV